MKKIILLLMAAAVSVAGISCTRPLAVSVGAQPEQVSAIQAAVNDYKKDRHKGNFKFRSGHCAAGNVKYRVRA